MERVVIFTGAGVSAESGLNTFRDSDGLWEGHDVMSVASIDGWYKDPKLVLDFYNQRRKDLKKAKPNLAHEALVQLEKKFEVSIITQNVDDLHERAGSSDVLHLHGELLWARSTNFSKDRYPIEGDELNLGDLCDKGSQLRPDIVWFGEIVPMMPRAISIVSEADIFIVIGSSLIVYPAASLIEYVKPGVPKYIIDPKLPSLRFSNDFHLIEEKASTGAVKVVRELMK